MLVNPNYIETETDSIPILNTATYITSAEQFIRVFRTPTPDSYMAYGALLEWAECSNFDPDWMESILMNDHYTENLLMEIIKAQNKLLKGEKIPCTQEYISSLKVEAILAWTKDLFTSDELAELFGVEPSAMQVSMDKAQKRMDFIEKYWYHMVFGVISILLIILGLLYVFH